MFFAEARVRVFIYGQPVDARKSYDGLYALARNEMKQDPLSGHLFCFINRRANQIKVLASSVESVGNCSRFST
ncbi:IS66 family insertion sequence element accessory protein TnpB [Ferrovum myxofaciens]|uniref:IS66 family insertion sequence element accessory protein TnpB n=2 Tax=Ferrovum myxofaciens TaxID=416213 RepID=A0A9E6MVN5_9PROT|nr:IS66 family insertion sequence element accessory protein TnpB [Ferrovum myxofaciens]QKE39134.1 MAG: IS66 family insertion sequence element accessory protein TnpB [Ferrovum myxofaciens]QWY74375.1 MAG: IS66 family insertion sequence element accessory protein TnpB [Ferrovum myxofaciens]QWY77128.1 MAG: IS66 family insertion sequence element accessory protein TnpB [Ferrovum myxofaciens]